MESGQEEIASPQTVKPHEDTVTTDASEKPRLESSPQNSVDVLTSANEEGIEEWKPTWRFGMVVIALSTAGFTTALENTITGTALPTIIEDLNGADSYIWVVNAFTLTM